MGMGAPMGHVGKGNVICHPGGETLGEDSQLVMDIFEKGVGGPTAHLFDDNGGGTIEVHGRGSPSSQRVAAHRLGGEALVMQSHVGHRLLEVGVDVAGSDLVGHSLDTISGQAGVLAGGVFHDVGHSAGEGLDGAGGEVGAPVMDALSALTIFLVGNAQGCMVCLEQRGEIGGVGDDGFVFAAENDIPDPKSLCSGACGRFGVGIFSHSQQKVECHTNEVRNGPGFRDQ